MILEHLLTVGKPTASLFSFQTPSIYHNVAETQTLRVERGKSVAVWFGLGSFLLGAGALLTAIAYSSQIRRLRIEMEGTDDGAALSSFCSDTSEDRIGAMRGCMMPQDVKTPPFRTPHR
jgi:hypothetical protein